ncbi:DUF4393 domain-containing protein [Bacillus sp. SH5-2]|uniref:DUF4393 domain-containing protein n=1 Tax=Bacillus sp. SH5-2 TaxID=2217834 RepID=UPI0011EF08C8|nr:DUF4393 domain-containing protein [Bacillus sp. SH5-2]KAA0764402.1 DUF4393 domain-containing protein [Bacillus sp. SH5-2]
MEINIIPKFLDEAVTPVAQRAGNTLSSIWGIVFGGIDIYAEKTQIKRVHALNQFKEELEQAVASIPEENIIEPPLHIVGPSLEASKYYFENDKLRRMFTKLIAASFNKETISNAHPSFVEIIKQLSPLDAINLYLFQEREALPIAHYKYITNRGGSITFKTNVFLESTQNMDVDLNSTSISNLNRLGLISISYSEQLQLKELYEKFSTAPFYKNELQEVKRNIPNININNSETVNESAEERPPYLDIFITNGIASLTPLGKSFIRTCIK